MKIPLVNGIPEQQIGEVVSSVINIKNVRRATAYISEKFTIKATAQRKMDGRERQTTILVTVGAPNFVERRFIRLNKKQGVCFPMKQVQLQWWPKPKAATK